MQIIETAIQQDMYNRTHQSWAAGNKNTMVVLPTGGGKTVVGGAVLKAEPGPKVAIAHRQELVGQLSVALGQREIHHKIIGPREVVRFIIRLHMEKLGRPYYDPQASTAVAGVDTLIRRQKQLAPWAQSVGLWLMDEGHHITKTNKWGKAANMFPNARGCALTATPTRASGEGLGRHSDGLMDDLIVGPPGRHMINEGYLTDYIIYAPPQSIRMGADTVSKATGDYNPVKLRAASQKSTIVGDVVEHYLRLASGKLGITFCSDVHTATDIAAQYNAEGVPARMVCGETPDAEREQSIRMFQRREILQLVNVDLFGEGFDVPAVEVVSFARPTMSYSLYSQQFGRGLRPLVVDCPGFYQLDREGRLAAIAASTKPRVIIIDHVGNVLKHGLPDADHDWTLDRRDRASSAGPTGTPVTVCTACSRSYRRILGRTCPYCGHYTPPVSRSGPEFVDGDLMELDAETLERMRGDIATVDLDPELLRAQLAAKGCPTVGQMAHVKRHADRQTAQAALRQVVAWWAGLQRVFGRSDSESYRRFYKAFGVDVMTAQTLSKDDAIKLAEKISANIGRIQHG